MARKMSGDYRQKERIGKTELGVAERRTSEKGKCHSLQVQACN
jgi:hypothetical protein